MVLLEIVGVDGKALFSVELNSKETYVQIKKFEKWVLHSGNSYLEVEEYILDKVMEEMRFIRGLENLPLLNHFLIETCVKNNRVLSFDRWPNIESSISTLEYLSLPRCFLPASVVHLANYASYTLKVDHANPEDRVDHLLDFLRKRMRKFEVFHEKITDGTIALFPVELPPYILLWIGDWLPNALLFKESTKVELIFSLYQSARKRDVERRQKLVAL